MFGFNINKKVGFDANDYGIQPYDPNKFASVATPMNTQQNTTMDKPIVPQQAMQTYAPVVQNESKKYKGLTQDEEDSLLSYVKGNVYKADEIYPGILQNKQDKAFIADRRNMLQQAIVSSTKETDKSKKESANIMVKLATFADYIREKEMNNGALGVSSVSDDEILGKTMQGSVLGEEGAKSEFSKYLNGELNVEDIHNLLITGKKPAKAEDNTDGSILGDIAGGIAKSATATAELGANAGDWLGYNIVKSIFGEEKANEVKAKLGDSFGNTIDDTLKKAGIDTNSTSFSIGKGLGDTAQILAPTGKVGIISKIPGMEKIPGVVKTGVDLFGKGVIDTQKATLITDKRIATPTETTAGGVLNLVLGGAINGLKQVANTSVGTQTKDVLKNTSIDELNNYISITKASKKSIENPTAFEYASSKIDDAIGQLKNSADEVGSKIGEIRLGAADTKAHLLSIVDKVNPELQKYGNIGIKFTNKGYVLNQSSRISTLPKDELAMMQDLVSQLNKIKKSTNIGDLLNINKYLLNNANKIEKGSNEFKAIITNVRKGINGSIENATPVEYKGLLKDYAKTQGLLDDILLKNGPEGLRGETLMRSIFNSNSKGTRDLFNRIKESTGLDLFKEAQLAKFVSDSMGDTRGLKQILGDSFKSAIAKGLLDKGKDIIANPIRGAKQIIQGTKSINPSKVSGIITEKLSNIVGGD